MPTYSIMIRTRSACFKRCIIIDDKGSSSATWCSCQWMVTLDRLGRSVVSPFNQTPLSVTSRRVTPEVPRNAIAKENHCISRHAYILRPTNI